MRKCPTCGFNNLDTRTRCLKCSSALESVAVPDGSHVADASPPRFAGISASLRRSLYLLRERLRGELPTGVPRRFPWSAAYLSLLPGAGQLYNRQPLKAFVFVCIYLMLVGIFLFSFFEPWNNWILGVLVAWLFYAMADGYSLAVRINGEPWRLRNVFTVWFSVMFYLGAFLFLGQFLGFGFFFIPTVKSPGLAPAFKKGDKLFVLGFPFAASRIRRGSVVYYDPPRFAVLYGQNTYSLNEKNSFGVVSAEAGDMMEVDSRGQIRVNGSPVPPNQLPLNPTGFPLSQSYRIPKEHYGILFSHRVVEDGLLSFLGGSYAGNLPTPRELSETGVGLQFYDKAVQVPAEEIDGIVLFRFQPPERRQWFGFGRGIWHEYPSDYPVE